MSPVPYTWGPFSAKIFLKIWFCKIDPLLPPHIDFNTIPYFTYGCPYRGVKEGKLKTAKKIIPKPWKRGGKKGERKKRLTFHTRYSGHESKRCTGGKEREREKKGCLSVLTVTFKKGGTQTVA